MTATFTSKIAVFTGQLWKHHIIVADEVANDFISKGHKRIICEVNGIQKWQTALMKTTEYWFILLNQQMMDACGLAVYDSIHLIIEADNSEYGMDMPEELAEMLIQDSLLHTYFSKLTPGKQRNLIYIVNKVKSSESKLKKVLAISHHLIEMKGEIDYKLLNETIKKFNKLAY